MVFKVTFPLEAGADIVGCVPLFMLFKVVSPREAGGDVVRCVPSFVAGELLSAARKFLNLAQSAAATS